MTTTKLLTSIIFNLTIATLLALSVFVPGCAFLFSAVIIAIFILHSIQIAIFGIEGLISPCSILLCLPLKCCELLCGELSCDDFLNFMIGSVRVGSVIGLGLIVIFNVTLPITIPTLAIIYIASSAAFILKDMTNVILNLTCTNTQYQSTNSEMNTNDSSFNKMNCSFSRTNDHKFVSPSGSFFKNTGDRNNSINRHSSDEQNAINNFLQYRQYRQ